jgi:outer membrane lipoprotein-sorting protein
MTRTWLAILALLSAFASPAFPAPREPPPQDATDAMFARLEQAAAEVRTISSGFVQEKRLAMFKTVVSSKGRFYFQKPDRLRWETTEPVASGFVLNGNKGRRWHQRTGRDEPFDIRREPIMKIVSDQILAWAKPDIARLRKEYRIRVLAEDPLSLRLDPISAAAAGTPDHLRITISPDGRYVRTVEIREKDGDSTVIRFIDTVVNRPIAPERFE